MMHARPALAQGRAPLTWLALACVLATLGCARHAPSPARGPRFVHLSDLHCAHATENPRPRFPFDPHRKDLVGSFELLAATVRHINETVQPDFVVITGDLADRGDDLQSLQRVKAILDKLACPYYPVIGDHDRRATWLQVFGACRLCYEFAHGGWRFIAVDSSSGRLDASALDWLRSRLAEDPATPTALLIHRPLAVPWPYRVAAMRVYGVPLLLENADDVLALLEAHPNVRAVFAGHCHTPIQCRSAGIAHCLAPSLVEPGHGFHVIELGGAAIARQPLAVER